MASRSTKKKFWPGPFWPGPFAWPEQSKSNVRLPSGKYCFYQTFVLEPQSGRVAHTCCWASPVKRRALYSHLAKSYSIFHFCDWTQPPWWPPGPRSIFGIRPNFVSRAKVEPFVQAEQTVGRLQTKNSKIRRLGSTPVQGGKFIEGNERNSTVHVFSRKYHISGLVKRFDRSGSRPKVGRTFGGGGSQSIIIGRRRRPHYRETQPIIIGRLRQ